MLSYKEFQLILEGNKKPERPVNEEDVPFVISPEFRRRIQTINSPIAKYLIRFADEAPIFDITMVDVVEDEPTLVRYVHKPGVSPSALQYLKKGQYPPTDKGNKHHRSRIGRLLRQFPEKFDQQTVEEFVNTYRAKGETTNQFKLVSDWRTIAKYLNRKNQVSGGSLGSSCMRDFPEEKYRIWGINDGVHVLCMFDKDVTDGIPKDAKLIGRAIVYDTYTVDGKRADNKVMANVFVVNHAHKKIFDKIAKDNGWLNNGIGNGVDARGKTHTVSVVIWRGPEKLTTPLPYYDTFGSKKIDDEKYVIGNNAKEVDLAVKLLRKGA